MVLISNARGRAARLTAVFIMAAFVVSGCGGGGGSDSETPADGATPSDDGGADGGDAADAGVDPSRVKACELLEPAEVQEIAAANLDSLIGDSTAEVTGVAAGRPDGSDATCVWEVATFFPEEFQGFKDDLATAGVGGEPPAGTAERSTNVRMVAGAVGPGGEAECAFEHQGLCLKFDQFGDAAAPVIPDPIAQALRARLDG